MRHILAGAVAVFMAFSLRGEPDVTLRALLGVRTLTMTVPSVAPGTDVEVAGLYFHKGKRITVMGPFNAKPGSVVELLLKNEGTQTRALVSASGGSSMQLLPSILDESYAGKAVPNGSPLELPDGWIGISHYSIVNPMPPMPPGQTIVIPTEKLETMVRSSSRCVIVLAYRPRK